MKEIILRILGALESAVFGASSIYIPRVRLRVGGPRSFMTLFCENLRARGYHITKNRYASAACAMIPIAMDPDCLRKWKQTSMDRKVVQRLDGVFYEPESSDYDAERNEQLAAIYHEMSDVIIFQSQYSKRQCEHFLGLPLNHPKSSIIHNGTDLKLFRPDVQKGPLLRRTIKFITSGNFRDSEMLLPLLQALDVLKKKANWNFNLEVVGPIAPGIELHQNERPYLELSGSCHRERLAEKLAQADIFLFSFLNPNCPNSVIEATASGLPVVSFKSGSLPELLDFNSELLAEIESSHPIIHKRSEIERSVDGLVSKIELCVNEYERFRARVIDSRSRFDIEKVIEAYLEQLLPSK